MSSTTSFIVFFLLSLGMTVTDAARNGLLRVGALRHQNNVPLATSSSNRALANEEFQMMFRKLFTYESYGADSMAKLSMAQLSMVQFSMAELSMSRFSMADLSTAPLSMVGLSMTTGFPTFPETDNSVKDGDNTSGSNGATIQGPGDNETIQVNDGMRVGVSTGLMAAGFLMLVVAAFSVYKMKRYAALTQTVGDELSVPTAV